MVTSGEVVGDDPVDLRDAWLDLTGDESLPEWFDKDSTVNCFDYHAAIRDHMIQIAKRLYEMT